mmetsp:Transcript_49610/g.128719  ORF Transcript_49610/g.128719 Transcript_49610/m.128719 type:complete len:338 (+) Transcript_49610:528-1541(+)
MEFEHRDERDLRGPQATADQLREEPLPQRVVARVAAALEEVRQDDVVWAEASGLQVFEQLQRLLQVVLVHERPDHHGGRRDVRGRQAVRLHVVVELHGLREATGPREGPEEHDAHALRPFAPDAQQRVHCGLGRTHAAALDARVQERREGDPVGLQPVLDQGAEAPAALLDRAGPGKSLERRVVGHHVDNPLLLALLEPVRVAEDEGGTLGLARVGAGQQQQVEHQAAGAGAEPSERRLRGVHVPQGAEDAEEEHVVLGVQIGPREPRQHRRRPLWGTRLERGVDEAGVHDPVLGDQVAEGLVRREAGAKVLSARQHPQRRLPEAQRDRHARALHGP